MRKHLYSISPYRGGPHRGMTLLELLVSIAILGAISLLTFSVLSVTSRNMRFELADSDQAKWASFALDRMVNDFLMMRSSDPDFVSLDSSDTVYFQIPQWSQPAGDIVAGPGIVYIRKLNPREAPGNGLDDDQNGLTDGEDGQILRFEDNNLDGLPDPETEQLVCGNIPAAGFLVVKQGHRLIVRVAVRNRLNTMQTPGNVLETSAIHHTYCLRN